jgi:hypothetical protein
MGGCNWLWRWRRQRGVEAGQVDAPLPAEADRAGQRRRHAAETRDRWRVGAEAQPPQGFEGDQVDHGVVGCATARTSAMKPVWKSVRAMLVHRRGSASAIC